MPGESAVQTAYQLRVRDEDGSLVFDSGRTESRESQQIVLRIPGLLPSRVYGWEVCAWDGDGKPSVWSEPSSFATGLLPPDGWERLPFLTARAPLEERLRNTFWFRRDAVLPKADGPVLLHLTSIGQHELWINGARAEGRPLAPSRSNLRGFRRALAVTYDVTALVREGMNRIGVWLDADWARSEDAEPCFAAALCAGGLRLTTADGNWLCRRAGTEHTGGFTWSDFGGERIVCGAENGWLDGEAAPPVWSEAAVCGARPRVASDLTDGNEVSGVFPAVRTEADGDAVRIDMGQNYTGQAELIVRGAEPGKAISLEISDKESETCSFHQKSEWIPRREEETLRNRFQYFAGRYLTLRSEGKLPEVVSARGLRLSQKTGKLPELRCSVPLIERIFQMDLDTFLSATLSGVTVDCPHRERLGYGETAISTFWGIGVHCGGLRAFYRQTLRSWRDCQAEDGSFPHVAPNFHGGGGPLWSASPAVTLWDSYRWRPDRELVRENYGAIARWADYLLSRLDNGLVRFPEGDPIDCLGDWATPEGGDWGGSENAVFFHQCAAVLSLRIAARFASLLGKTEDAARFAPACAALAAQAHRRFWNPRAGFYLNGEQRYLAAALCSGLVPDEALPAARGALTEALARKRYLDGGSAGTVFLFRAVGEILRRPDLLYEKLLSRSYPGYGYFLEQGETTLPELWSIADDWGGSRIHTCYSGVSGALIRYLVGLSPSETGIRDCVLSPFFPDDMDRLSFSADYGYGDVSVGWEREAKKISYRLTLPANTTARLLAPGGWDIAGHGAQAVLLPGAHELTLTQNA